MLLALKRFSLFVVLAASLASGLFLLAVNGVIGTTSLPEATVASSVSRDSTQLDQAFELPVASLYGRDLYSQRNGSLCGPASLVNVFRSFEETVNDESEVLQRSGFCETGLCFMGLTLDELAEVARTHSQRKVLVLRDLSPEQFREELRGSNDPSRRLVVNFSREPIFGMGGGHHSPIGGYLEADDLVLVLDVNAEFGPWLIERDRLYAAMDTMDGDKKRGLLRID